MCLWKARFVDFFVAFFWLVHTVEENITLELIPVCLYYAQITSLPVNDQTGSRSHRRGAMGAHDNEGLDDDDDAGNRTSRGMGMNIDRRVDLMSKLAGGAAQEFLPQVAASFKTQQQQQQPQQHHRYPHQYNPQQQFQQQQFQQQRQGATTTVAPMAPAPPMAAAAAADPAPAPSVTPPTIAAPAPVASGGDAPTRFVLVKNMFDPAEETEPNWAQEIEEDTIDECKKFGLVESCKVDTQSPEGKVYIVFDTAQAASKAFQALNGRWFAKRQVKCSYSPTVDF